MTRGKIKTFLVAFWFCLAVIGAGVPVALSSPAPKTSMDTIRQQIIDKLKLRLARISIANGFETDIGASIQTADQAEQSDWRTNVDEPEIREQTLLGIFDREMEITQDYPREGLVSNVLPIQVRAYHMRGTSPRELRKMIGDLEKAVSENETSGAVDPQFRDWDQAAGDYVKCSQLAIDMKQTRSGFIVPTNVLAIDAAAVEFQVEYLTQPFNAYE